MKFSQNTAAPLSALGQCRDLAPDVLSLQFQTIAFLGCTKVAQLIIVLIDVLKVLCSDPQLSDYLHLIQHSRLPQGYEYSARSGFSPGLIGSEHVPVVLPPVKVPGRSRLNPWYTVSRDRWIHETMEDPNLESICKRAAQPWLYCVFRWMHFLRQGEKLNEIQKAEKEDFRKALKQTIVGASAFRLEYIAFYCHLRRVWQVGKDGDWHEVYSDPYGLCPRVCSDRSGIAAETVASESGHLIRPENRFMQCVPSSGMPTVLTTSCVPDRRGEFKNDLF
uniref:Ras-GEF domain-containing protein n=1 Tax=Mesocestoides corti TaxID=53468 RepID=A0A5K3EQ48_MESCO